MTLIRTATAAQPSRFSSLLDSIISSHRAAQPAKQDDQEDTKDRREDDEDDEKEKARKARKKAKADPDDEDTTDEDDPKAKAARARERQRIAAIMSSAAARRDPVTAMHMSVDTTTPRGQAIALLGSLADAADDDRTRRAEARPRSGGIMATARAILRAGRKARGEVACAEPTDPMAREIIAAGKKARGEA